MTLAGQARECLDAATFSVVGALRDGRAVEIRALKPADRAALMSAVDRISDGSMTRRFFGARRHFGEQEIDRFVNVDFVAHVALVAIDQATGEIVAGGRYVLVDPGRAEVAFAVIDAYQGQGLGGLLMRHLTSIARRGGLRQLVAEVLAVNRPMMLVFEKSGLPLAIRRDGAVIHVTMEL